MHGAEQAIETYLLGVHLVNTLIPLAASRRWPFLLVRLNSSVQPQSDRSPSRSFLRFATRRQVFQRFSNVYHPPRTQCGAIERHSARRCRMDKRRAKRPRVLTWLERCVLDATSIAIQAHWIAAKGNECPWTSSQKERSVSIPRQSCARSAVLVWSVGSSGTFDRDTAPAKTARQACLRCTTRLNPRRESILAWTV